MLKKAVKLLRGSVCLRAKSAYPERMLNLCSARGIEFWDVRWIDDTALSFCVARGDLRALRRAAEGCGAEVSIERTAGTPFFFARLRRRRALFAGGILCAALLLVNSLFIWDFEVSGSETVPAEKILRVLEKQGLRRGSFAHSFRPQDICNRALPELPGVLGVQVNVAERCHEMKTIFRAGFQQIFERLYRFSVLLCRKFFTVKFRRHFDLLFRVCSTPAHRRNVRFSGTWRVRARLCPESRTNRRHGRDGAGIAFCCSPFSEKQLTSI